VRVLAGCSWLAAGWLAALQQQCSNDSKTRSTQERVRATDEEEELASNSDCWYMLL
jgi:hypothetical protein